MHPRAVVTEALGTAALVATCLVPAAMSWGLVWTGLWTGATVGIIVRMTITSSGAHLNPAVTLAMAGSGRFPWRGVVAYIVAQTTGGVLGAAAMLAWTAQGRSATTIPVPAALGVEAVATACLMLAILLAIRHGPDAIAGAVGVAVCVGILWAGPLTGAAMNPARGLAPWLVDGMSGHWTMGLLFLGVYVLGPCMGAGLVVASARLLPRRQEAVV